jgi:hypothetical protein
MAAAMGAAEGVVGAGGLCGRDPAPPPFRVIERLFVGVSAARHDEVLVTLGWLGLL